MSCRLRGVKGRGWYLCSFATYLNGVTAKLCPEIHWIGAKWAVASLCSNFNAYNKLAEVRATFLELDDVKNGIVDQRGVSGCR